MHLRLHLAQAAISAVPLSVTSLCGSHPFGGHGATILGMPSAIAFFPWIAVDEPLTVGSVRLIPYERGRLPGDSPNVQQKDIDGIFAAYASRKNTPISIATLLEVDDWKLGEDAAGKAGDLFRARDLIAFAALAKRRLFHGHFDYCNADCYQLVIQNYTPDQAGSFSFGTRRRDGGYRIMWGTNDFAFYRPLHVASIERVKLDEPLLVALQAADRKDQLPHAAIVGFNLANTDSSDVPQHTEVVMTKSAFEHLFEIGTKVDAFVDALLALVPEREPDVEFNGPLVNRWRERFPKARRLLETWAREFCDLRGGAAHGAERGGKRFVWSSHAHLAFASILFPLAVKQRLAEQGFLEMSERDSIELAIVEAYLTHDPFDAALIDDDSHPWRQVEADVSNKMLRTQLEKEFAAVDWENLAE